MGVPKTYRDLYDLGLFNITLLDGMNQVAIRQGINMQSLSIQNEVRPLKVKLFSGGIFKIELRGVNLGLFVARGELWHFKNWPLGCIENFLINPEMGRVCVPAIKVLIYDTHLAP